MQSKVSGIFKAGNERDTYLELPIIMVKKKYKAGLHTMRRVCRWVGKTSSSHGFTATLCILPFMYLIKVLPVYRVIDITHIPVKIGSADFHSYVPVP